ncbi:hypothetical protein D041_4060B, partial [Vibrio parahaemolyticus EKP-008]
SSFG